MSANRSTAVMQRRRVAPDSLDYFPTPPFATRALAEFLAGEVGGRAALRELTAWEPACGEMHMARPLREYFKTVRASDVHRYTDDHEVLDFTLCWSGEPSVDFVITNPPFRLAQRFIETGLRVARRGVAMLVRGAFLEGGERHATLFAVNPPSFVLPFVERVVMLEGRLVRRGAVDPFAANPGDKATTATSYCWLVWLHGVGDTRLRWIRPCIASLEKTGDYPSYDLPETEFAGGGLFQAAS